MHATSHAFKSNAHEALVDATLQKALGIMKGGFQVRRAEAIAKLPEFEALRDAGRAIKNHTLENLDFYLEAFETKVTARGGHVHWCRTPAEARDAVLGICQRLGAKTVTKGKSMIAEEIALNDFLEANHVVPVETDLGEYIIQLRHEPPSHIIAPAVHLVKEQVADTFRESHRDLDPARPLPDARTLCDEARAVLRQKFLRADVGITGANFLIAETGSSVIVTNEGNGDLTQTLTKAHIVLASLEKVVPTLEDAATILRLLARSATGQEFSAYTTFSTGPRRAEDTDGPGEYHVILLDNGRSAMLGTEFQDMLRCIRCSACLNHCPVYAAVGGHAYGWVYPGPMGSVLTPNLIGVEEAGHLPNASTFCGRCESVCPMKIPLPKMMRHWREREFTQNLSPRPYRAGLSLWAFLARRPALYHAMVGIATRVLGAFGRGRGRFRTLPLASGWTSVRDMPAPEGRSFQSLWGERQKKKVHHRGTEGTEKKT
ncbi:MAG TPA: LutB/LldF family L-lactate oxidation iron-sulfur protein [Stellaceae bacterium]|nr:LutB/LldF family L-lactate oxidation iron-sulfur protein [Stellaceae bacterium]